MSTFNFTVRATDDQGAFADRDFSINVKNDKIVKTIVSDGTNVYTSTNPGTDAFITRNGITTSTLPLSPTTGPLTYGNGIWVASNSSNYHTSIDGINWLSQTYPFALAASAPITDTSLDASYRRQANSYYIASNIRFTGGMFFLQIAVFSTAINFNFMTYMLCSSDAVNWKLFSPNYQGTTANNINNTNYPGGIFNEFVYDGTDIYGFSLSFPTSNSTTTNYNLVRSTTKSDGTKSWIYPNNVSTAGSKLNCTGLAYINGLWIATSISGASGNYYTSNDLVTWTGRTISGKSTPILYSNGTITTIYLPNGGSTTALSSIDGITWSSIQAPMNISNNPVISSLYNGNILYVNIRSLYSYNGTTITSLSSSSITSGIINGVATTG